MLRKARSMVRAARNLPVIGAAVRATDRFWWARTIRRADVVDIDFVRAQGLSATPRAAVRAYVRGGFRRGMSLNPLFAEQLVSSQLPDAGRVPAMYAYLVNDPRAIQTSISWDAPAYARAQPGSLTSPGGPLGHAWRRARSEGEIVLGSDERRSRVMWRSVSETVAAAVKRARGAEQAKPVFEVLQSTIVIARIGEAERDLGSTLSAVGELVEDGATLVVAIDSRDVTTWTEASLLPLWLPNVITCSDSPERVRKLERCAPAGASIIVRGPNAEITARDLRLLARAAREVGVAVPLWLDSHDGTVAAAGVVVHDGDAYPLLAGHPAEDARALVSPLVSPGLASETFARVVDASPFHVTTVLDATVRAPGPTTAIDAAAYDPTARSDVNGILAPLRMRVARWSVEGPQLTRSPVARITVDGRSIPRLRWAIKIVAPPGKHGEAWGDTHFARGIADALRRLGQEVVIDAYDARSRPSSHLDDVILALRGPEPFAAQPGSTSLLWIISHPDQVTAAEIREFDRVYAGSTAWARWGSQRFGRHIVPLLQCTDATRFHPVGGARTDEVVFVGTARGIPRPSVIEPIRAGIPVSVYGPDWRGWIPAHAIKGTGVPNSELPALYEHASVVLNDHWPAMREAGFISNRLYDVVAAGGRAVSDHVDGIDELFEGAVATYQTIPQLLDLLRKDRAAVFPDEEAIARISQRVRERDSFDARARTLLDDALAHRRDGV